MTQKEMAALVNRSVVTIQKIELGNLALGKDLANEIAMQTGISLDWLLANDPSQPPTAVEAGAPYTKSHFESRQSFLQHKFTTWEDEPRYLRMELCNIILGIGGTISNVLKTRKIMLYFWKLNKVCEELSVEFGYDNKIWHKRNRNRKDILSIPGIEKTTIERLEDIWRSFDTELSRPSETSKKHSSPSNPQSSAPRKRPKHSRKSHPKPASNKLELQAAGRRPT